MSEKIGQLKLQSTDGKSYKTDCANTETMFRIIQSIPSPKAEPFKRWLAKVGYERVQEIEDPELATKRTRALYKAKGYSDDWIEKRMRGIAIRAELTDEWKNRDVKEDREYSILTEHEDQSMAGGDRRCVRPCVHAGLPRVAGYAADIPAGDVRRPAPAQHRLPGSRLGRDAHGERARRRRGGRGRHRGCDPGGPARRGGAE